MLKQLFSADATILKKSTNEKLKKTPSKVAKQNIFFLYCPELPKRPKQKNSCAIIWLIDRLNIKLGFTSWTFIVKFYEDSESGAVV